jgi:hypothetical protein
VNNQTLTDPFSTPAPATVLPALIEAYPACFDWEQPRPLKIGIHQDLVAAGFEKAAIKRALGRYCNRPLYRRALQAGAVRLDLQGQASGVVAADEVRTAPRRPRRNPSSPAKAALSANATPVPEEYLVPGRLELTVKFSELPRPLAVRDGLKIGIQTGEGIVTAILPPKVWRTLERATQDYPQWVAALSGSLERFADGEIALKHPALQVFEKKVRPEAAAEGKGPEPNGPAVEAPGAKASAPKAPDSNGPAVEAPEIKAPEIKAPEIKAPEIKAPEIKAPEIKAPDVNASAGKKPEGKAAAVKAPDRNTPAAAGVAPPYPKLSLKGRAAAQGD